MQNNTNRIFINNANVLFSLITDLEHFRPVSARSERSAAMKLRCSVGVIKKPQQIKVFLKEKNGPINKYTNLSFRKKLNETIINTERLRGAH